MGQAKKPTGKAEKQKDELEKPKVVVCQNENDFIETLRKERDKGQGFVPLIGAGLSAPSGIPVTHELKTYLQRCIALALGLNNPECWSPQRSTRDADYQNYRRWLPGRDQWPPFGGPQIIGRDSVNWEERLQIVLSKISSSSNHHQERSLFQEAYGAMADWRTALLFLSRLRLSINGERLLLRSEEPDVIDTFFLNVILEKRATLGHRMLARLASPLRASPVLTTNFDDLIEQAFLEINRPLTPFDVHVESGLPSHRDMIGKNCIVKLHGGRYGLRADYSLDAPPSDADCRHFVEYLVNCPISEDEWWETKTTPNDTPATPRNVQKHLLVVGCGGNDERILRFIQVAAEKTKGLKVFWLCYSQKDIEEAKVSLNRACNSAKGNDCSAVILSHHFFGLFFIQMYQELSRSLPSSGVIFPYAPRVPVPPEWGDASEYPKENVNEDLKRFQDDVSTEIEVCCTGKLSPNSCRFILLKSDHGTLNGATTALSGVFHKQLEKGRQAVWIDMDEAKGTDDFFEVMINAVSRKAGIVDWTPVLVHKEEVLPVLSPDAHELLEDSESIRHLQVREIARLTNNPNRKWVLFLNARSGAGKNLEDEFNNPVPGSDKPNGWLDNELSSDPPFQEEKNRTGNGPYFLELLKRLSSKECPNLTVVLSCYESKLVDFCNDVMPERSCPPRPKLPAGLFSDPQGNGNSGSKKVQDIVHSALELIAKNSSKSRFLYAMCLTNRPRFLALLWSRTFHGDMVSEKRFENTKAWLTELEKIHVIRRKLGGFVWMHCEVRNGLRLELAKLPELKKQEAELHHGLCESYWRLFLASDDAMAAFEAIYHQFHRMLSTLRYETKAYAEQLPQWLAEVLHLLEIARPAMLSVGFTKGICRWLTYCRETMVKAIRECPELKNLRSDLQVSIEIILKTVCIETTRLQRDIAREVGENAIAAKRHRTLRALIVERMGHLEYEKVKEKIHEPENDKEIELLLKKILFPHEIFKTGNVEPVYEWIDSETQLGTLGIAARSYIFSEKRFENVYKRMKIQTQDIDADSDENSFQNCQKWIAEWKSRLFNKLNDSEHSRFQTTLGLTKALGRDLQLQLAWGQQLHLCERRGITLTQEKSSTQHFRSANLRYIWAAEIMKYAHQHEERNYWMQYGYHLKREDFRGWYDERQRLDTQHSLALAYLGDFDKAHRRLNEAESSLRQARISTFSTEQAIIELHRAEVYTLQACFRAPRERKNGHRPVRLSKGQALEKFRGFVLDRISSTDNHDYDALNDYIDNFNPEWLRSSSAFIDDAWQALERASRLLDRQRKNVWWTTWFFDLRIKLIELRAFEAVVLRSPSIPYLGLEAVPHKYPTLADEMLDASKRIVRHDTFRFAHTLESYAHALLAFTLWRKVLSSNQEKVMQETSKSHLRRQHQLAEILSGPLPSGEATAPQVINRLLNQRDKYDQAWGTTEIDTDVTSYISSVMHKVSLIHRLAAAND